MVQLRKSEDTKDSKPVFDPNQILHKLKQKTNIINSGLLTKENNLLWPNSFITNKLATLVAIRAAEAGAFLTVGSKKYFKNPDC